MITLRREFGRYKIYTIDIRNWLSEDSREEFIEQLRVLLQGRDAEEGYEIVSVIPFQGEFVVTMKA